LTGPQGIPAGWYPDPERPGAQRYWDGGQWTEYQLGLQQHPPPVVWQPLGQRPPKDHTWKWLVAGVVGLLIVIGAAASGSSHDKNPPNVVGKNGKEAERLLQENDFEAEFVSDPVFGRDKCRVTRQSKPRDGVLNPSVKLRCEFPVPDVVGQELGRAVSRLSAASMQPEPSDRAFAAWGRGARCEVTRQSVMGTALWQTEVRLRARCQNQSRQPQQSSEHKRECDPNYRGACVPPYPPDVDCDSISGPVAVIGKDVHALDSNDDGQACEGP
jgi:hypothetical protein